MTKEEKSPIRLGLIYPGGGCEGDFYRFEDESKGVARVYLSNSQFGTVDGEDHHPDALRQTANVEWIADAANRLRKIPIDAMVWACTSGSFINGREFAEEQALRLTEMTKVKFTSTSLAFAAAAQAHSITRVSILATYPEPAAKAFSAFLGEYDIDVINLNSLGFESGWISSNLSSSDIVSAAKSAINPGADALLIPDTALPTLDVVEEIENASGIPVLTATAVSLWHGLKICARVAPVEHLGQLLAR